VTEQNNLSERVAVVENDIEHLQDGINNVGNVMRQTAKAHNEKLDKVLLIVGETRAELNRYKIISGTAVAILAGLMAGANYLMGIFGVSLADLWHKKV
jgi:hypothetical protein